MQVKALVEGGATDFEVRIANHIFHALAWLTHKGKMLVVFTVPMGIETPPNYTNDCRLLSARMPLARLKLPPAGIFHRLHAKAL